MSEAFSLFYCNKNLLHKSSEQSSLISGPGLNSSPLEAKNPSVFRGLATTFQWHHKLNGHEFEQTPGDGEGQESLACCSPLGRKELDITEQLNHNKNNWTR